VLARDQSKALVSASAIQLKSLLALTGLSRDEVTEARGPSQPPGAEGTRGARSERPVVSPAAHAMGLCPLSPPPSRARGYSSCKETHDHDQFWSPSAE
jgi:hypothetical protein